MRYSPSLAAALLLSVAAHAQTGPGGVGSTSSNVLWLDANSGVTFSGSSVSGWADRSGNGNSAAQSTSNLQPVYVTNAINGYPAIQFDDDAAAPDQLRIPDHATLEGMSGLTGFCVYQLGAGTPENIPRCMLSKRIGADNQESYAWFIYNSVSGTGSRFQNLDIDGTGNRATSTTSFNSGTNYINSFIYHGALPSNTNDQMLYSGNINVGSRVETSTSVPNYASDVYLGFLSGHGGSRFNGSISELIVFNYTMGAAQHIIVNNYLSAKYGTTLVVNDVYTQDNAANGNYDHDMAGIGRVSSTDLQTDSRGTGIVQISNASDLNDDEFLLWGHNNGSLGIWGVSDRPAGLQGRWQRTWRVSEVSTSGAAVDVGATDIVFDLTGLGTVTAGDLRLLVDANNNGVFADDAPITGATSVGSNKYKFTAVTALVDGRRFTLGTTNVTSTPLPIELLSFTAKATEEQRVDLAWTTASERDNDHFTVERSSDLNDWTSVLDQPGAGNSGQQIAYSAVDEEPLFGRSYYRLRQVDTDGSSTWSDAVPVFLDPTSRLDLFPTPTHGPVYARLPNADTFAWSVLDAEGRFVAAPHHVGSDGFSMDLAGLPGGLYLLHWSSGTDHGVRRFVLE